MCEFVLVFVLAFALYQLIVIRYRSIGSGCHSVQKEDQQQFFIAAHDMNGSEAAAACDVLITAMEETREFYIEGGEYLPLGVWMTRGFDAVHIKERSRDSDVIQDPVLGTVYRVRILQRGNAGSRTTLTTRNLKRKQGQLDNISGAGSSNDHLPPPEEEPADVPALMDGTAESVDKSSDSSSSSSSSSSSDKKKKKKSNKKGKKGKKNKKDKKDKKKAKKEAKKEAKARKDCSVPW
jgi:hypothetical protein